MKVTGHIYARWNEYSKAFNYALFGYTMNSEGYVYIKTVDIPFESPTEKELKVQTIASLRRKKVQVDADAAEEKMNIDEQISELLAIEDRSDDAAKGGEDEPF